MTYIFFIIALIATWYYCRIEYYSRGYKDGLDDASEVVDDLIEQEKIYAEKFKGDFGEQVAIHTIEILCYNLKEDISELRQG